MAAANLTLKVKVIYEMSHDELQDAITCTNALLSRATDSSPSCEQLSAHLKKLLQIQLIRAGSIKHSHQMGSSIAESLSTD